MTTIDANLLLQVANLNAPPTGAFNIRKNGKLDARGKSENIEIFTKEDKSGIDIKIAPHTKGEQVHIPVIITESGLTEMVYNDFFVGEGADVDIIAGCGIHNDGHNRSQHDGIHTFYVGKGAKIRYSEKHYGEGEGTGQRVMNPTTVVYLEENASITMDMVQIKGVDSTHRVTTVTAGAGAEVFVNEKLLTHGSQFAQSDMEVILAGADSSGRVVSRSVAQDQSQQVFCPKITGRAKCFGHVQCDSIIMDQSTIKSIPAIVAESPEAQLIHEAAIGRIAGDQILKLMTLGLTEEEAEEKILNGFLQ